MVFEVEYGVEFTRNLGNFENVKPSFRVRGTVETAEAVDALKEELELKVDQWLTDKVEQLEEELKELGLGKQ